MAGAIKTLYNTLSADLILAANNVKISLGEESVQAAEDGRPYLCIIPVGGVYDEPGYSKGMDPNIEDIWMVRATIDMQLVNSSLIDGAVAADHYEAVENLRSWVLQALKAQAATGLYFRPVSGRWLQMLGAVSRYGRTYVLNVAVDIGIPDVTPVEATVTSVTHTETI